MRTIFICHFYLKKKLNFVQTLPWKQWNQKSMLNSVNFRFSSRLVENHVIFDSFQTKKKREMIFSHCQVQTHIAFTQWVYPKHNWYNFQILYYLTKVIRVKQLFKWCEIYFMLLFSLVCVMFCSGYSFFASLSSQSCFVITTNVTENSFSGVLVKRKRRVHKRGGTLVYRDYVKLSVR